MIVLIPALIENDEAERLLRSTLAHLSSTTGVTLALISQGREPHLGSLPGVKELRQRNYPGRIGKWSAIRAGLELVSDKSHEPLLLMDADDPVPGGSLYRALERFAPADIDCLIGDRKAIALGAEDQRSAHTRAFVEIFSNTLLLQRLRVENAVPGPAPDIQSGFYILSARARQAVKLHHVADYGGELALYHELVSNRIRPTSFGIDANPSVASSYNIRGILGSIARLPFFSSVSADDLNRALQAAPLLYSRYLVRGLAGSFRLEMTPLVESAFEVSLP